MIVCDGMGGAKSGNVASSLAVEVFTGEVRRTQKAGMTPEKAAAMLHSALELANRAVYEQSQLSEDFTGMGTTLVAAFLSLSNEMADQEMLFEVVHGMSKSDCCQRLLHIAKKRGAPDNVTVALAAV